jgi:hypothetical protein
VQINRYGSLSSFNLLEYLQYSGLNCHDDSFGHETAKSQDPRLGGYIVSLVSLFKGQIDLIQIQVSHS